MPRARRLRKVDAASRRVPTFAYPLLATFSRLLPPRFHTFFKNEFATSWGNPRYPHIQKPFAARPIASTTEGLNHTTILGLTPSADRLRPPDPLRPIALNQHAFHFRSS